MRGVKVENFFHFFAVGGDFGASEQGKHELASVLKTKNDGRFRDNGTQRATVQDVAHTLRI
jgi:hypothetical protein